MRATAEVMIQRLRERGREGEREKGREGEREKASLLVTRQRWTSELSSKG